MPRDAKKKKLPRPKTVTRFTDSGRREVESAPREARTVVRGAGGRVVATDVDHSVAGVGRAITTGRIDDALETIIERKRRTRSAGR